MSNNGLTIINLYNGIYKLITNDTAILEYVGLSVDATFSQKGPKFQKQSKPQQLANNVPLIAFYTPGGSVDYVNLDVFRPVFFFDIYTPDNVNLAHQIAERLCELLTGCLNFSGVGGSSATVLDAHESDSNLENVYCFTVEVAFSNSEG